MTTRPTTGGLHGAAVRAAYAAVPAAELLARYLDARDEAAFRELVDRFSGVVGRACRAVLGRDDLARDAFQETFLKLVRHGHALRHRDGLAAWLDRVARAVASNIRRREARQRRHAMATAADPRPDSPDPLPADEAAKLRAALAALPDRYRLPLELVYLDGLTHAEAAQRLGRPKGTVDAAVSRGLKRLRAALGTTPAVAVALPAAARAVPAEWVEATVRAAAAVVLRSAGLAGSVAAWWATRPTAALAWAGVAGLVACEIVAAAALSAPTPTPLPPVVVAPPTAEPESLPARNKRVLEGEVLPKVVAALRPLALNGGDVAVTRLEAHDFRAFFFVEVRHKDLPPEYATTHTRVFLDTRTGAATVMTRLRESDGFAPVDPARPVTLLVVPALGIDWKLRSEPLAAAVAELKRFPPDPRAGPAAERHAADLRKALEPYRGTWLYRGDPRLRTPFGLTPPAGPDDPVELAAVNGGTFTRHALVLVLEPDGRLREWFWDHPYTLSADGRRLDWPGTAHWWERVE